GGMHRDQGKAGEVRQRAAQDVVWTHRARRRDPGAIALERQLESAQVAVERYALGRAERVTQLEWWRERRQRRARIRVGGVDRERGADSAQPARQWRIRAMIESEPTRGRRLALANQDEAYVWRGVNHKEALLQCS